MNATKFSASFPLNSSFEFTNCSASAGGLYGGGSFDGFEASVGVAVVVGIPGSGCAGAVATGVSAFRAASLGRTTRKYAAAITPMPSTNSTTRIPRINGSFDFFFGAAATGGNG